MELSEGDKTIKLNEIIKEYTEQLADIKNTNCLKIKKNIIFKKYKSYTMYKYF